VFAEPGVLSPTFCLHCCRPIRLMSKGIFRNLVLVLPASVIGGVHLLPQCTVYADISVVCYHVIMCSLKHLYITCCYLFLHYTCPLKLTTCNYQVFQFFIKKIGFTIYMQFDHILLVHPEQNPNGKCKSEHLVIV